MRSFAKVSLAILLMAVLAWASDPWKSKPYQEWDQKDIAKILSDSPWARGISVTASWRPEGMSMGRQAGGGQPNIAQQQGGMGGQQGMGGQPGMGGGIPGDNGQGARMQRETTFVARWVSAQTMREALARMEVLNGKMAQPNAERYIAQVPPDYQIVVFGPDMTPFAQLDEASLVKDSYLETKKSKEQIAPASVKFDRSPDEKRLSAISFSFPKTANGKPTIAPDEKGMDLVCKMKDVTLRFHFDAQKMTNKQGRDL